MNRWMRRFARGWKCGGFGASGLVVVAARACWSWSTPAKPRTPRPVPRRWSIARRLIGALEHEQLLLRHRRLVAAFRGDVGVREVEQPQQLVQIIPADPGVHGAAVIRPVFEPDRWAAERAVELAGHREHVVAPRLDVQPP